MLEDTGDVIKPFRQFGIEDYFQDESYIEFRYGELHITYSDKKFALTYNGVTDKTQLVTLIRELINKKASVMMQRLGMPKVGTAGNNAEILLSNNRASLYIPAERNFAGTFSQSLANMMLANIPLPFTFMSYLKYFEQSKKKYPIYEIPFLNVTYKNHQESEGVMIQKDGGSRLLQLSKCSSGIQSALPMLMILDYCTEQNLFSSYVIEEPEQNLFPNNQLSMLRFMIKKIHNGRNIKMNTITTHSPYILSAVNISLLAGMIASDERYINEVESVLPSEYHLLTENVAAYALGEEDIYCRNIINNETGTIDQNYLDTTSVLMAQEFGSLYKLFLKTLKK